ncbi:protein phosphatase 2C domain-containing protein [Pseudoalteromonas sp. SR44-5]|uniref:protein phosphatase 2C domain-containing protein n=1 Tax=Pseudoalteromonas sp. SR44-5 TaxID=2760934 RepID=UPI0016004489|nr:protein phosphatase 2C domain-containing protein [Pseudoalteromonas sp. SR44-5]MBB1369014.1 protein phosphatase 2C domain-containing protein [Pseudoalteromonas sp. SR44-5]
MYEVTGATHRGKSHIENNMSNQDSFCSISISGTEKKGALIAVADGHGSEAHKYSAAGAKIAISVTKAIFPALVKLGFTSSKLLKQLSKTVLYQWQKSVLDYHYKNHSDEEFSFVLYGTTLRFVMIDENSNAFFFSVGDGITAIFDKTGNPSFFENSHGSNTDEPTASLCNASLSDLKYQFINLDESSGVLVATDGFDTFLNTAKNLKKHFVHTVMFSSGKTLQTNIEGLSREYSQINNEDDSSIAIVKLQQELSHEHLPSEVSLTEKQEETL